MNEFCTKKGIRREFNNARTPQQNGVTERRNKTLIEAARTMVLVNKSQNKTPYKLFNSRIPAIGFLRPFGCHVMILNTLDHLGKFDAKGDKGTSSTNILGTQDVASQAVKKDVSSLRYIALPNWFHEAHIEIKNSDGCNADDPESSGISNPTATSKIPSVEQVEPAVSLTMETKFPLDFSQQETPSLGNALTLSNWFDDIFGEEADLSNMETSIPVSPTPTVRIHKDNPKSQIIGPVDTPVQTRHKSKEMKEQRVRPISTKWVLKNKKDERGIVIRNKVRLYSIPEFPDRVYKVEKAMYGLHQAPRAWYGTLSKYLLDNGFQRVLQKKDGIFLPQDKYVGDILKKFGYLDVRSANTPMDKENPWGKDGPGKDIELHLYRSMIRSLMYLTASRPDIMFTVCACARHQVTPKKCHLHVVKRIFRYLKGHPKLGLWYPKDSLFNLVAYSNSDYGGATQDRKSTTGGCRFLGRRLISWQCKKQTIVTTSTTEAEDVAAANGYGQLAFCDYHNMIAILEKTEHNINFHQIVDFLEASHIRQYSRRAIRIAQSKALSPAADEHASLLRDDSQGEAFPTVSSLDARHDRENINKTSALPHESSPRVTSLDADEGTQDLEISSLNARVKILEDKDRGSAEPSQKDAPIKGGSMEIGEEVRVKRSIELGSNDTEEMVNVLSSMEATNILTSGVAAISVFPVADVSTVGVSTVSGLFPAVSAIFTTASVVTPYSRRPKEISAKDKGKEKVVKSEVPNKRKLQEQIDAQVAKEMEEEFARENQKESLDRSNEVIATHLQEYEQAKAELTVGERVELINELEQREFYILVLRSYAGWKTTHFRGMTLEEIKEKIIPVWKQLEDFVPMSSKEKGERIKTKGLKLDQRSAKKIKTSEEDLKGMMQLVPLEEVYVEALQVKHPIIDLEIHSEGQREEDLHQLWILVKETLSIKHATKDKEKELWVELKRLFEPDFEDQLWTHNQVFMHHPLEWKLYDTCGFHHVFTKDQEIFMLVETDYPLRKGLATVMICNKLRVEQYS
nr:uncharacterized mitochondrial protein AtMg00810-like [Tanacetum cinerariifolium]